MKKRQIIKTIKSQTPVRINDIGGWTDTWFSKQGKVLKLDIKIHSSIPAGSSTGTSGSVSVALLGALDSITSRKHSPGKRIQSIPVSLNLQGLEVSTQS